MEPGLVRQFLQGYTNHRHRLPPYAQRDPVAAVSGYRFHRCAPSVPAAVFLPFQGVVDVGQSWGIFKHWLSSGEYIDFCFPNTIYALWHLAQLLSRIGFTIELPPFR